LVDFSSVENKYGPSTILSDSTYVNPPQFILRDGLDLRILRSRKFETIPAGELNVLQRNHFMFAILKGKG